MPVMEIRQSGVCSMGKKVQSNIPLFVQEEKAKKIRELSAELDSTNQRCEVYRANLLAVLRDMEDQKLKLSVKVQNARLSLKE